jgi:hypothetical protein
MSENLYSENLDNDTCISCEEDPDPDDPIDYDNYKCPKSKRPCGHHCNHPWNLEECCWCQFDPMRIEEDGVQEP